MSKEFSELLAKVVRSMEDARDELLDWAKDCVKTDDGNWSEVETVFNLARDVHVIRQQIKTYLESQKPLVPTAKADPSSNKETAQASRRGLSLRKQKEAYPKYVARSGCLVKIGLGRDKKTEYEHEVPRREFDRIVARLSDCARSHREFTIEDVQKGLDCPSYQTYIVVALLVQKGVLASPWRGTYTCPSPEKLPMQAASIWSQLPQLHASSGNTTL